MDKTTKYWMVTRRNHHYEESWEERAFAEDAACVWPPRSYSCSFCGREFRSAQALGGHMNVHRRDRARLKLSGISCCDNDKSDRALPLNNHCLQPYCPPTLATPTFSPHVSYIPHSNPNPNPNSISSVAAHPPPFPSGSLAISAKRSRSDQHILSSPHHLFVSTIDRDYTRKETRRSCRFTNEPINDPKPTPILPLPALSVSRDELKLSITICRARQYPDKAEDEEQIIGSKRQRTNQISPSFLTSSARKLQQQNAANSEVLNLCSSNRVEELDLELRLGDAPKLK